MRVREALMGLIFSVSIVGGVAQAAQECKTPKGQRCVCAATSPKKCAHIAKAICLSGKIVETPVGQLLTAHENNKELFKQCSDLGGMKEVVSNIPLLDSFGNTPAAPVKQDTAATGN